MTILKISLASFIFLSCVSGFPSTLNRVMGKEERGWRRGGKAYLSIYIGELNAVSGERAPALFCRNLEEKILSDLAEK